MADAVTDEMIDTIALAGTPEEVRDRYAERWAGVYERTLLWPPAYRGEPAVLAAIEAFAGRVEPAPAGPRYLCRGRASGHNPACRTTEGVAWAASEQDGR